MIGIAEIGYVQHNFTLSHLVAVLYITTVSCYNSCYLKSLRPLNS